MGLYCDKIDCFGNNNSICLVLTDTELKRECPFYKTLLQKYSEEVRIMESLEARQMADCITEYYGGMDCFQKKLESLKLKVELLKE